MAELLDAMVIGGGPAGSTAGLVLARAGWRVLVIEKARFPRRKVCGEYLSATNLPLLSRLGIAEEFLKLSGPPVRQAGLFAQDAVVTAPMPRAEEAPDGWGRALGREVLDRLLLESAAHAGARVCQPWWATRLKRKKGIFLCEITSRDTGERQEIRAPIVIAAHGSWESGGLTTQTPRVE